MILLVRSRHAEVSPKARRTWDASRHFYPRGHHSFSYSAWCSASTCLRAVASDTKPCHLESNPLIGTHNYCMRLGTDPRGTRPVSSNRFRQSIPPPLGRRVSNSLNKPQVHKPVGSKSRLASAKSFQHKEHLTTFLIPFGLVKPAGILYLFGAENARSSSIPHKSHWDPW